MDLESFLAMVQLEQEHQLKMEFISENTFCLIAVVVHAAGGKVTVPFEDRANWAQGMTLHGEENEDGSVTYTTTIDPNSKEKVKVTDKFRNVHPRHKKSTIVAAEPKRQQ